VFLLMCRCVLGVDFGHRVLDFCKLLASIRQNCREQGFQEKVK
jgi:hypothetical protein